MSDHKFTTLRKRLDQLGYRQPLPLEAVPLVEKLFSDLVHTTESFKNFKQKHKQIDGDFDKINHKEAYRKDNAKLVKQNNELHQKLMNCRDEVEKLQIDMKSAIHKLENENQDLKFLNTQYVKKIKDLEKESKQKSDHIQNLQEKNLQAVVETPGGKRKNIPFRRQRMDVDGTVRPASADSLSTMDSIASVKDLYVADLLEVADRRIEEMKQNFDRVEDTSKHLERKIKRMLGQIRSRDDEIARLNGLLGNGRPSEAVLKENFKSSSDRVLSQLNIQVDYLQQSNRDLEKKLNEQVRLQTEATSTIKSLKGRNDELCMELAAMNKLYKTLGKEKKTGDQEVDKQITELRNEVDSKMDEIRELQNNITNLKKERDGLLQENENLQLAIKDTKQDTQHMLELLERSDKERKRLAEKNAKLTVTERELVMDLERLKISKGIFHKRLESHDSVEYLVKNLEDDRDYYKNEYMLLQKLVHDKFSRGKRNIEISGDTTDTNSRSDFNQKLHSPPTREYSSPTKDYDLHKEKGTTIPNLDVINRLRKERDQLQKQLQNFENELSKIQVKINDVTSDRDKAGSLYEQAASEIFRLRQQLNRSLSLPNHGKHANPIFGKEKILRDDLLDDFRKARVDSLSPPQQNLEAVRLRKERDQLQKQLKNFEEELPKIQLKVKDLTSERDNVRLLYEQSTDEMVRLRQQLNRARSPGSYGTQAINIIEKAEAERDEALNELRKTRVDLQTLKETIKDIEEATLKDKRVQESKDNDYEKLLDKFENNNIDLQKRVTSMQSMVDTYEKQLQSVNGTVRELRDEINEKDTNISKLKLLLQQSERTVTDIKRKFEVKSTEFTDKVKQADDLQQRTEKLEKDCADKANQIERLKSTVATLDNEKDELYREVDEKAVLLVQLDQGLRDQETADNELRCTLEEFEENLRYQKDELNTKDKEIKSLISQVRSLEEELAGLSKSRELTIKENRRIQDDLATMTAENQVVHKNLQDALEDSNTLKQQVEEYALQLGRVQELLEQKEMEKEELLFQYKTLSDKAGLLQADAQNSAGEMNSYRQDLVHRQQQIVFLEDKVGALQSEVEQSITTQEAYENQVAILNQSLANLEAKLCECNEEKGKLSEDLFAVRDLCVKLDKTREELTKKVSAKTSDRQQFEQLLEEMRIESEMLKKQLLAEKENVSALQQIISTNRENEYHEKQSQNMERIEKAQLSEKVVKLEKERDLKQERLDQLLKENLKLQAEVTTLQRKLTTERYEKERLSREAERTVLVSYREQGKSGATEKKAPLTTASDLPILRGSFVTTNTKSAISQPYEKSPTSVSYSPINVSISSDGNVDEKDSNATKK